MNLYESALVYIYHRAPWMIIEFLTFVSKHILLVFWRTKQYCSNVCFVSLRISSVCRSCSQNSRVRRSDDDEKQTKSIFYWFHTNRPSSCVMDTWAGRWDFQEKFSIFDDYFYTHVDVVRVRRVIIGDGSMRWFPPGLPAGEWKLLPFLCGVRWSPEACWSAIATVTSSWIVSMLRLEWLLKPEIISRKLFFKIKFLLVDKFHHLHWVWEFVFEIEKMLQSSKFTKFMRFMANSCFPIYSLAHLYMEFNCFGFLSLILLITR